MHQFHTKSSFGNACKQFALCAILDPSTFVAQPLLILVYATALILFAVHGLLLESPVFLVCAMVDFSSLCAGSDRSDKHQH